MQDIKYKYVWKLKYAVDSVLDKAREIYRGQSPPTVCSDFNKFNLRCFWDQNKLVQKFRMTDMKEYLRITYTSLEDKVMKPIEKPSKTNRYGANYNEAGRCP